MATTTYNIAKAVSLVKYEKPFQFAADGLDWGYGSLVSEAKSDTKTKQVFPVAGLPVPTLTKELQDFYFADMAELGAVTITIYKYTLSFKLSWEAKHYGEKTLGDIMADRGKEMGSNHKYLKGLIIATDWNNIATNTVYDSVAVAGSHTTRAGNTVNTALTASAFDFDSAWDSYNFFRTSLYNHSGLRVQSKPFAMVGSPSLRKDFEKVFESIAEPDTLANKNTMANKGIRFIENPHATSSTRYTFVSDGIKNDYRVYVVQAPTTDTDEDKTHHAICLLSWQALGSGWVDFFHIVSNAGV